MTEAIHESGFNSSGRFYATPRRFSACRRVIFATAAPMPTCGLLSANVPLDRSWLPSATKAFRQFSSATTRMTSFAHFRIDSRKPISSAATAPSRGVAKVIGLIEEPATSFDLPLDVRGTAFQHRVWQALRDIPAGTTATYSEIAKRIGMPKAMRAVAAACAANKLAVAIPCHRVVRNDGSLSGYRWGVERKRALIARETKG